jgi:acyl-CoA dehydrogenase
MIRDEETFNQLLSTISRFVRERLVPNEDRVEEECRVPDDVVAEMRQLGLSAGQAIPEEYGGLGLTSEEKIMISLEVSQTSPAYARWLGIGGGLGQLIASEGTEEQKRTWLPRLAAGELIGAFALTEPDSGSDAGSLRTTARRENDVFVLNGTKRFISNAPFADVFLVMPRTDPDSKGGEGVSAFLVEGNTPGLSRGKTDRKMGLRGSETCDVILDDCRVPAGYLIGKEGKGFKTAMKELDFVRLELAAVCVGAAERLIRESVMYAKQRVQFGKPIAEFQLIQAMLADSRAEAYATRCMVLDAARRHDLSERISTEIACCKLFATEMVGRVADRAVQIHGGAGYMVGTVERFYRDVRIYRIWDGTNQIQQLLIARHMLRDAN